jgi:hypothetical protein
MCPKVAQSITTATRASAITIIGAMYPLLLSAALSSAICVWMICSDYMKMMNLLQIVATPPSVVELQASGKPAPALDRHNNFKRVVPL